MSAGTGATGGPGSNDPGSDESGPGEPGPDDFDFEIPDDLSGLDELLSSGAPAAPGAAPAAPEQEPAEPVIALVVTQVAGARPLAAACALAGIDADVVPSPVGAIAVLRDTQDRETTARGTEAISRLLRAVPVVLLDRRAGRIEASRWSAGTREDDLAPGLVLSGAPEVLEDLLVGTLDVHDAPGVETSVGMSRWAAMRALSQGRRKPGAS